MIVYDLICSDGAHAFEGWFGSSSDYESQKKDGLLVCPICGSAHVEKAMMAPNLGRKGNQQSGVVPASTEPSGTPAPTQLTTEAKQTAAVQVPNEYAELIGKLAKAQEKALSNSEWVGDSFAEEARSMHYGESEVKAIHGTASPEDAEDLSDEGIDITPLPLPVIPPETQN